MLFPKRSADLLSRLTPYLVATPNNLRHLDRNPFGIRISDEMVINPLCVSSEPFLAALERLDALTFGPEGMPMPRWVFYDCSELPGAIFGLGVAAQDVPISVREVYRISDHYKGLLPFSMYIAIPMFRRGDWFGHNLCSISPTLPDLGLGGLGSVTKALALKCFRVQHFFGATQWDSTALFIHTKFGALDLMTAFTPAHSEEKTLTYHFPVTDERLASAMDTTKTDAGRSVADFYIHIDDTPAIVDLQDQIEAGFQFRIPGPPEPDSNGGLRVPIVRL